MRTAWIEPRCICPAGCVHTMVRGYPMAWGNIRSLGNGGRSTIDSAEYLQKGRLVFCLRRAMVNLSLMLQMIDAGTDANTI